MTDESRQTPSKTVSHDWIKSTLGHGETMCRKCFITNREAAVLGRSDICEAATPPRAQTMEEAAAENFGLSADDLDEECPICGGEGFTFDCFDGCCADADVGCDDCTRPCECQRPLTNSRPPEGAR